MGRVWPSDTVNCQSSANAVTGVRQQGAVREGEPNRVPQARVGDLRDVKILQSDWCCRNLCVHSRARAGLEGVAPRGY